MITKKILKIKGKYKVLVNYRNAKNEDWFKEYKKIFSLSTKSNLDFEKIGKIYDDGIKVIHDFNLSIQPGEFVSLLGPSGCGKTTLLRMVAGLEDITEGIIRLNETILNNSLPKDRKLSMVFQNYSLYPYMNIYKNIAFGLKNKTWDNEVSNNILEDIIFLKKPNFFKIKKLKLDNKKIKNYNREKISLTKLELLKNKAIEKSKKKHIELKDRITNLKKINNNYYQKNKIQYYKNKKNIKQLRKIKVTIDKIKIDKLFKEYYESIIIWKKSINKRVHFYSKMVGIESYLNKKPAQLSGGQRQRVALVRSISKNSSLFLFDEPLSNLDAKLRTSMRTEIKKIHNKLSAISIFVTHDQVEAMTISDKIVLMNKGFIHQIGTPIELFNYPSNVFVADFIGSPSINFLNSIVKSKNEITLGKNKKIIMSNKTHEINKIISQYKGKNVIVGIRPQNIIVDTDLMIKTPENSFNVKIEMVEILGHENIYTCSHPLLSDNFKFITNKYFNKKIGEIAKIFLNPNSILLFDKKTGKAISYKLNEETEKALKIWENSSDERIKNINIKKHNMMKLNNQTLIKRAKILISRKKTEDIVSKEKTLMEMNNESRGN